MGFAYILPMGCSKTLRASTANTHTTWCGHFAYTLSALCIIELSSAASCIAKTLLKIYMVILLLIVYQKTNVVKEKTR